MNKEDKYKNLLKTIEYTIKVNKNIRYLTLMCEIVNLYKGTFENMHWVGFYLEDSDKKLLYLGPYIGNDACEEIPFSRGVCGKAYSDKKTQLVDDVHSLPYHIACSSTTNSEIVVPVMEGDHCLAVFDIDSDNHASFDTIDQEYTEKICKILADQHSVFSQLKFQ